MNPTPTTPQWAIDAAKEMLVCVGNGPFTKIDWDYGAAILAKHAPPLSPPTDEAKLREVIEKAIDATNNPPYFDKLPKWSEAKGELIHRLLSALAPRDSGDSELLDWLLTYITQHGLRGLKKLAWTVYDEDGESLMHRKTITEDEVGDCRFDRAALKSAQRGEGKP